MRRGRRLAFDVGAARTGVAVCDPDCIFASPIGAIDSIEAAQELIAEYNPIELYVGYPLNLRGESTASTTRAVEFAKQIAEASGLEVRLIDERLTTTTASSLLRAGGKNSRAAKPVIDAASATLILEQALALEKAGSRVGLGILEAL